MMDSHFPGKIDSTTIRREIDGEMVSRDRNPPLAQVETALCRGEWQKIGGGDTNLSKADNFLEHRVATMDLSAG